MGCFVAMLRAMTEVDFKHQRQSSSRAQRRDPASSWITHWVASSLRFSQGRKWSSSTNASRHCQRSDATQLHPGSRTGLPRRNAPRNDGSGVRAQTPAVIASAATRPSFILDHTMGCFVAMLRAMTEVDFKHQRQSSSRAQRRDPASSWITHWVASSLRFSQGRKWSSSTNASRHCQRSDATQLHPGSRTGLPRRNAPRNDGSGVQAQTPAVIASAAKQSREGARVMVVRIRGFRHG